MKKIKRTYIHCDMLEEAPMWGSSNATRQDEMVDSCVNLFREYDMFEQACRNVLKEWPNSSLHNLSARVLNRIAWMGQAAQCVNHGAVEYETRTAWRLLDNEEREKCNRIAFNVIEEWERCQK